MRKWQDTREMLRLVSRTYVEPYLHDVFVKIIPGLVLILGVFAVLFGILFALDLVSVLSNFSELRGWIFALFAIILAWIVGALLQKVGHGIGYAKALQPDGWDKYVWLEAVQSFDELVPLSARRKASSLQTLSLTCVGLGTASTILFLFKIIEAWTVWAWILLIVAIGLALLALFHRFIEDRWKIAIGVVLVILLIVALTRLPGPWFVWLLIGIVGLRLLHILFRKLWHRAISRVFPNQNAVPIKPRETPLYLGPQGSTSEDEMYKGSSFAAVKETLEQNPYYSVWGNGQSPLPVYQVTLGSVLRGILPFGNPWQFREAARRTVDTRADIRTGVNGRGYRRLLHPNGVCLFGTWEITKSTPYTGYFAQGKKALLIGRYSTCCTEVRRGRKRSLSLVGKLFPTEVPTEEVKTASFITQQDLGGEKNEYINQAEFRNAPDTRAWRRGLGPNGLPVISITGLLFKLVDVEPSIRQLYEIAELGKDEDTPTNAPKFMRILVDENQPKVEGTDLDFRDEIMAHLYEPGDKKNKRELAFNIEVADEGETRGPLFYERRKIEGWRQIGKLVFTEGVISYNGDHLIHFNHPSWRRNRNEPKTQVRRAGQRLD